MKNRRILHHIVSGSTTGFAIPKKYNNLSIWIDATYEIAYKIIISIDKNGYIIHFIYNHVFLTTDLKPKDQYNQLNHKVSYSQIICELIYPWHHCYKRGLLSKNKRTIHAFI